MRAARRVGGRRAFTLVELVMTLAVTGLMSGFALQAMQSGGNASSDCYVATKQQMSTIHAAIDHYVAANDKLPLPAMRTVGVESPMFGRAATAGQLDTAGSITYGALPFQALGLSPSYAGDCWGNKFTYAVTTALTSSANYTAVPPTASAPYLGTIAVQSGAGNVFLTNAAYAVVSHGADGIGAVKLNYNDATNTQRKWCTGNATLEGRNCLVNGGNLVAAEFNDGKNAGNAKFDDIVTYAAKPTHLVNGACNNTTQNGCTTGTAGNTNAACSSGSITATWECDGSNGGTNATGCTTVVGSCFNGTCGATLNTCTTGTPGSSVPGSCGGNATWSCAGSPGNPGPPVIPAGTPAACSLANAACTVNGVCDNTTLNSCTSGTLSSPNAGVCGGNATWTCSGSGGGTSGACTLANSPCPVNGGWTAWSVCAGACGAGSQARTCTNPAPAYGLRRCHQPDLRTGCLCARRWRVQFHHRRLHCRFRQRLQRRHLRHRGQLVLCRHQWRRHRAVHLHQRTLRRQWRLQQRHPQRLHHRHHRFPQRRRLRR
jgi:prepilin-type N-terminal cleavage/methylation domain-containing protein